MRRVGSGDVTGQNMLCGSEFPNGDGTKAIRGFPGEIRVDGRVMLSVVADQEPLHLGQLGGKPPQGVRLRSRPDRNHPVLVGPQSVNSNGPSGKPCRARNPVRVGATFHAPVDK